MNSILLIAEIFSYCFVLLCFSFFLLNWRSDFAYRQFFLQNRLVLSSNSPAGDSVKRGIFNECFSCLLLFIQLDEIHYSFTHLWLINNIELVMNTEWIIHFISSQTFYSIKAMDCIFLLTACNTIKSSV